MNSDQCVPIKVCLQLKILTKCTGCLVSSVSNQRIYTVTSQTKSSSKALEMCCSPSKRLFLYFSWEQLFSDVAVETQSRKPGRQFCVLQRAADRSRLAHKNGVGWERSLASKKGRGRNREENGEYKRENVKSIHRKVFVSRYGVKKTNEKVRTPGERGRERNEINTYLSSVYFCLCTET